MTIDKNHVLDEIRRTANANGGVPLGRKQFEAATGIRSAEWQFKLWKAWGDAVREAGLTPNKLQQPFDGAALLESYARLAHELGRVPTDGDLRLRRATDLAFPNSKVFARFGAKRAQVEHLLAHCRQHAEHASVAAMCESYLSSTVAPAQSEPVGEPEMGWVYLGKSGRYHKIGKSNAVGRRESELAIQLPERLTIVHKIRTDDPGGIEAYWHRRFADRRKNGEWFELRAEDVLAFKRRKFM